MQSSPLFFFHSLFLLTCLGGCASAVRTSSPAVTPNVPDPVENLATAFPLSRDAARFTTISRDLTDQEKLALLWQKRTRERASSDYLIGPGDVLEISAPAMEELSSRTVRMSGEGTVS